MGLSQTLDGQNSGGAGLGGGWENQKLSLGYVLCELPVRQPSGSVWLAVGSIGLEFQVGEVWTGGGGAVGGGEQSVGCLLMASGGLQLMVMTRSRVKP